jgi:hypothetical protein
MRKLASLAALTLALAACNPMELANAATQRAAEQVIVSVLSQELPAPVAQAAARCVLAEASPEELRAIAADIGVMAGTQTVENIRNLALRPQAVQCFVASSVPALAQGI